MLILASGVTSKDAGLVHEVPVVGIEHPRPLSIPLTNTVTFTGAVGCVIVAESLERVPGLMKGIGTVASASATVTWEKPDGGR